MVYRAAVLSLLGALLYLHLAQELRDHHNVTQLRQALAEHGAAHGRPAPSAAQAAPDMVVVDASRLGLEQMLASTDTFGPARIIPAMQGGEMIGFKLYALRPGTLLTTIGLKNGDTLLAVNDAPVSDLGRLVNALSPTPPFYDLSVLRQGAPVRIIALLH